MSEVSEEKLREKFIVRKFFLQERNMWMKIQLWNFSIRLLCTYHSLHDLVIPFRLLSWCSVAYVYWSSFTYELLPSPCERGSRCCAIRTRKLTLFWVLTFGHDTPTILHGLWETFKWSGLMTNIKTPTRDSTRPDHWMPAPSRKTDRR